MPPADSTRRRSGRWQFSLRTMMVGVTVFCVALSLAVWKGLLVAIGFLVAVNLCFLAVAAYRRRWRLAVCAGLSLLVPATALVLWFVAPFCLEISWCRICGKRMVKRTVLGVTCYTSEGDTERSKWYRSAGLRPHAEQWGRVWWTERGWGGEVMHYDTFGWYMDLEALDAFCEASPKMDKATFEDVAEAYYATREDRSKLRAFIERCETIVGPGKPSDTEP